MAIPFLNNLNLNDFQLLNTKLHVTSTAPTAAKGQIYLDSSDNILKYHNGTSWVSLVASTGGTVTSVSSGTTGQLTVSNGTTTPTLSIVTAPVTNGGSALATGDQIYDFVTGLGYLTTAVTSVTAGTGINVSASTGAVTITNTDLGSSQNIFKNFAVSGQSTVVADSNNDTLTLAAGSNVTITTNATTDTITIASTDTNTTYTLSAESATGGAGIALTGSDASGSSFKILGTTNEVEVTYNGTDVVVGLPENVTITGNLTVIGTTTTNNVETVSTSNGVIFEGNVADDNELMLLAGTLTADRTVYLPDASGTIALTSDLSARTFATTINDSASVSHSLNTRDVIVQLFDSVTYETVYADTLRTNTSTINITFGSTPTNPIRVLLTKVG